MRARVWIVFVAAVAAAPATARERIRGDGNPTTERRDVAPFTRVTLESVAEVSVKVGPAQSVAVTIDANLQEHLVTRVEKGTLVIDTDSRADIRPRQVPKVAITVPELRGFTLAGSGDVRIEGGKGPLSLALEGAGDLAWSGEATELQAALGGSGNLVLAGRAERLEARIGGSGNVEARRLTARSADAAVDGSGDVELHLGGGSLAASVSGSGDVRWSGEASVQSVSVSGSGRVARSD